MRPKGIILEEINKLPTNSFHQTRNLTIATRVLIEVMVDIRDILNQFLDKGSTWETRFIKTP